MKKTRKILLSVLSVLTIAAVSLGAASCELLDTLGQPVPPIDIPTVDNSSSDSSSSQTTDNEFRQVYAMYVVYAKEQGATPLSYEDWLQSIRGDKGDKGDQGEQGVGIEKVEYDTDGNLVITFTDGTTQTVVMPEPETHVHTFGDWITFSGENEPCENKIFYHVCTECKIIELKQGEYTDHDWTVVTTPPTCQAQGYDTKTCSICGKVEVGNYTDIVNHAWATEYDFDNSFHWYECNTCDEIKDKAEHTPDESGECSVCKALVGATEGVVYDVSADGMYAEVIGYEGTATRVRIADTYNDLPVKTIYEKAFYDNDKITAVIIPDSVTSIGDWAFRFCDSLTSVVIGNGVTSIGDSAFWYCDSLTSVVIGNSVASIGDDAFYNCRSLTSVKIPDSVTSIGDDAFENCSSLTSVTCPTIAISYIPKTNLQTVVITSGDSIPSSAFEDCSSLTSIEVSADNTAYQSIDGNLYTKDGKTLIQYARGKTATSFTIPDSVTSIGDSAFQYCYSLTSVEIPDSVTSIGERAFRGCHSLTSVVIGDSVTSIGDDAFAYCDSLTFNEYGNCQYLGNEENPYHALIRAKNTNYSSYTIHEDTKVIAYRAFYECARMGSIVIPDSVTSIGSFAFRDCSSLTSVVIGGSVTSIGEGAFYQCRSLTSVYYKGTASEWSAISIAGDNSPLTNATRYYYSETEPTEEGNYWHYVDGEVTVW